MNLRARDIFSRVVSLLILHGLSLIVFYGEATNFRIDILSLLFDRGHSLFLVGVVPLMVVAFISAFIVQSWREFVISLVVVIMVWQVQFLLLDWLRGRFSDPAWDQQRTFWLEEVMWRFYFPTAFVALGGLCGWLKKRSRFGPESWPA